MWDWVYACMVESHVYVGEIAYMVESKRAKRRVACMVGLGGVIVECWRLATKHWQPSATAKGTGVPAEPNR
jgi:hypothetical protein